jgi:DNA-binding XRE family transcriptional regulator
MQWEDVKKVLKSDEKVMKELQKNEFRSRLACEIIRLRVENNLTQKQLAEMVNMKQSNISRLESGEYNPSVELLKKIADALDKKLDIRFL